MAVLNCPECDNLFCVDCSLNNGKCDVCEGCSPIAYQCRDCEGLFCRYCDSDENYCKLCCHSLCTACYDKTIGSAAPYHCHDCRLTEQQRRAIDEERYAAAQLRATASIHTRGRGNLVGNTSDGVVDFKILTPLTTPYKEGITVWCVQVWNGEKYEELIGYRTKDLKEALLLAGKLRTEDKTKYQFKRQTVDYEAPRATYIVREVPPTVEPVLPLDNEQI